MNVLLAGATGTIGTATARRLVAAGHDTVCPLRPGRDLDVPGARKAVCDVSDPAALAALMADTRPEAVISCLASRSGAPADAWAVDHAAQLTLLDAAEAAGVRHFVLLSAICVQKPLLEFQKAKLAFEAALQARALTWSIVRPTAFFKSLSGQVARVQAGKPFLLFGDGRLTACKPISDADLAAYLVSCLADADKWNRILPIGGPGPAITPRDQGDRLFEMLGKAPRFKQVPVAMMDAICGTLGLVGRVSPRIADKAEFARTGRYYATESMLVWDAAAERYDAEATPEFGADTLWDHYAALIRGEATTDLGAHAVF
jgi:divinyl chlorophyllide a 8-vinyl-reductase